MPVRLVPHATLEAAAREAYARRYANVPAPSYANIPALLGMNQPITFAWGKVGYAGPPLSFVSGVRLMVAANALRELRTKGAPMALRRDAARVAGALLERVVRPTSGAFWRRWWRRRRGFRHDPPEEVEALCTWLIDVADEVTNPPPERAITIDLMDTLADFARQFPAWCDDSGMPRTWAHYLYGQRHAARVAHRQDLRAAIAARAAQADPKGFKLFERTMTNFAGWH